jgi:predicted  nucleic acid-binding Zn-ribbon protein
MSDSDGRKSYTDPTQILLDYRVGQLENKIDAQITDIKNMLGSIHKDIQTINNRGVNLEARLKHLEEDVEDLQSSEESQNEKINDLKVSLAERFAFTSVGGIIGGIISKMF